MRKQHFIGFALFLLLATNNASGAWEICTSNVITRTGVMFTNLAVRKIDKGAMRDDISPLVSFLFFPDKNEQIILDHDAKTFVRSATAEPERTDRIISVPPEQTTWEGKPAETHRWTNGFHRGSVWAASATPFLGSNSKLAHAVPVSAVMIPRLSVGSILDSNLIVVRTEYIAPIFPQSQKSEESRNLKDFILFSSLISLTETNLSPNEFKIPSDYTDATGVSPQVYQFNPALFGSGALDELEAPGKKHQKRGRIFPPRKGRSAN